MFEHRTEALLPTRIFLIRLSQCLLASSAVVAVSLLLGVLGYRSLEGMSWIDALLNASMILTGMGPVTELHTTGGKLFASGYALFSGVVFVTTAALLIAPIAHRLLHHFHLELDEKQDGPR